MPLSEARPPHALIFAFIDEERAVNRQPIVSCGSCQRRLKLQTSAD